MVASDLRKAVAQADTKPKELGKGDPHRAADTEKWLRSYGIPYTVLLKIPLDRINWRESRNNQARQKPIIQANVDRYALAMKEGAVFPPIVGHLEGDKVVYIDGNNRDAAARAAQQGFLYGFLVPTTGKNAVPSSTIYTMMVDANANHGETPDELWRLEQALHLQEYGLTAEQAARAAAVKPTAFSRYKRDLDASKRADRLRVKGFDTLSSGARVELGTIKLEVPFAQASQVAVDTGMTGTEVKVFKDAIKACNTEAEMNALIHETRKEREFEAAQHKAGTKKRTTNKLVGVTTGLGKIMNADPAQVAALLKTEEDRAIMMKRCEQAATKCIDIMSALEQHGKRAGKGRG